MSEKMTVSPEVTQSKKDESEQNRDNSSGASSYKLALFDKNGDGLIDDDEMPWKNAPPGTLPEDKDKVGCCKAWFSREKDHKGWFWVLLSFSWLAAFQKSPIVGTPSEQAAAIKETVNTVGLISALIITVTVPIISNPNDIEFEIKSGLWGSDVQVLDETITMILYFLLLLLSIVCHALSIGGVIWANMSISCLNEDLLPEYIEEVGSMLLLFPIATWLIGIVFFFYSIVAIALRTFGLYLTCFGIAIFFIAVLIPLVPFVYYAIKYLYVVPVRTQTNMEKDANSMLKVTPEDVASWLNNLNTKHFTEGFQKKKEEVAKIFGEEGISGMALPSVDMKFLEKKCGLNHGDSYLLMQEIKLRKGHVIHWQGVANTK